MRELPKELATHLSTTADVVNTSQVLQQSLAFATLALAEEQAEANRLKRLEILTLMLSNPGTGKLIGPQAINDIRVEILQGLGMGGPHK